MKKQPAVLSSAVAGTALIAALSLAPPAWGGEKMHWSELELVAATGVPDASKHGYSFKGLLTITSHSSTSGFSFEKGGFYSTSSSQIVAKFWVEGKGSWDASKNEARESLIFEGDVQGKLASTFKCNSDPWLTKQPCAVLSAHLATSQSQIRDWPGMIKKWRLPLTVQVVTLAKAAALSKKQASASPPPPPPPPPPASGKQPARTTPFRSVASPQGDFTITTKIVPAEHVGPCPVKVAFVATITAKKAGPVKYRLHVSDNAYDPVREMMFTAPGTKSFAVTRNLSGGTGWGFFEIAAPISASSEKAYYDIKCTTPPVPKLPRTSGKLPTPSAPSNDQLRMNITRPSGNGPDITSRPGVRVSGQYLAQWGQSITLSDAAARRAENGTCLFAVEHQARNAGGAASGAFSRRWHNANNSSATLVAAYPPIPAGGAETRVDTLALRPGTNVLTLALDNMDQVKESNEGNNLFKLTITVNGACRGVVSPSGTATGR